MDKCTMKLVIEDQDGNSVSEKQLEITWHSQDSQIVEELKKYHDLDVYKEMATIIQEGIVDKISDNEFNQFLEDSLKKSDQE